MPYFSGEAQHTLVSAQSHPSTAGQTHFPDYELPTWGGNERGKTFSWNFKGRKEA